MKRISAKKTARALTVLILSISVLSTGCSGCSKTESENVTTSGIYADIEVIGNSNGTTDVIADLEVGSGKAGTDLELSDGDRLTASANGQTRTLSKSENLVDVEYVTTFDTNEADMEVNVSLIRQNGLSAEDSWVTLPAPFTLITPTNGETFGLDDLVVFEWSPVDANKKVEVSSVIECHRHTEAEGTVSIYSAGIRQRIADDGFTTYKMRTLIGSPDAETYNLGCTVDLELSRSTAGTIDPNFGEGGRIIAKQSRTLEIRYTPDESTVP